jgi:hypothetical protein
VDEVYLCFVLCFVVGMLLLFVFFKNFVIFLVTLPLYVKVEYTNAYTSDVEESLKFKTFKGFKKKVVCETANN